MKHKYSFDEMMNLLAIWIEILYGKEVLEKLGLQSRVKDIVTCFANSNRPYYEGKKDAPHFFFRYPVDELIRELSEELPVYGS